MFTFSLMANYSRVTEINVNSCFSTFLPQLHLKCHHHHPSLQILIELCFLAVRQAREAALDAQLLVVATDLGKEKASQLFSEGNAFDPSAFAEHLVSTYLNAQDVKVRGGRYGPNIIPQCLLVF